MKFFTDIKQELLPILTLSLLLFGLNLSPVLAADLSFSGGFELGKGQTDKLKLSPQSKEKIINEMTQTNQAFNKILGALIIGDHKEIKKNALIIQKLSLHQKSQVQEGVQVDLNQLPPGFVRLSRRLNRITGQLTHGAKNKNLTKEQFLINRMLDTCIRCHQEFSPNRFPGLDPINPK
jgi:hypothetical protein